MRSLALFLVLFLAFSVVAVIAVAQTPADEAIPSTSTMSRLFYFGASMGLSFLSGAIQKRTLKSQTARNTIPLKNGAGVGIAAGALTMDPVTTVTAIVGSLAASGVQKVWKRTRTGRW